jgi:hypothetical protein
MTFSHGALSLTYFARFSCPNFLGHYRWGQIQISNANFIKINERYSRKQWMLELCDMMARFYPREIEKINSRIAYFERIRQQWEQKTDDSAPAEIHYRTLLAPPLLVGI